MTLAACFKIRGTPVLFSDLLVSRIGADQKHSRVPTHSDPSQILPEDWLNIVKGVVRKTLKIGDNFVIAGAGNLVAIKAAFKSILELDSESLHDPDRLTETLDDLDLRKLDLELCGWLRPESEKPPIAFHWCQDSGFSLGDRFVIGSGQRDFENDLSHYLDSGSEESPDETTARLRATEVAGNMIGQQQFTGFGLASLFGGGAEIFTYAEGAFEPVNRIAHVHWWADGMKLRCPPQLLLIQYYSGSFLKLNSVWGAGKYQGREEWYTAEPLAVYKPLKDKPSRPPQPRYLVNFCMTAFESPKYGFVVSSLEDLSHEYMKIHRSKKGVALDFHGERVASMLRPAMEQLQILGQEKD